MQKCLSASTTCYFRSSLAEMAVTKQLNFLLRCCHVCGHYIFCMQSVSDHHKMMLAITDLSLSNTSSWLGYYVNKYLEKTMA